MTTDDVLTIARRRLGELRRHGLHSHQQCEKSEESRQYTGGTDGAVGSTPGEISEICEKSPPAAGTPTPPLLADPFRAWRLRNAERLTDDDRRLGHDAGGWCAQHGRWLSYPEQQRGACSGCVAVDSEREPEYWTSHWKRFTTRESGPDSLRQAADRRPLPPGWAVYEQESQ